MLVPSSGAREVLPVPFLLPDVVGVFSVGLPSARCWPCRGLVAVYCFSRGERGACCDPLFGLYFLNRLVYLFIYFLEFITCPSPPLMDYTSYQSIVVVFSAFLIVFLLASTF